jgi:hypothetical protein
VTIEFTSFTPLGSRVRKVCARRKITIRRAAEEAGFTQTPNFFAVIAGRFGTKRGKSRARLLLWLRKWEGRGP